MKAILALLAVVFGFALALTLTEASEVPTGSAMRLVELLESNSGARAALRESEEGLALSRRLIGRPVASERDLQLVLERLTRPEGALASAVFQKHLSGFVAAEGKFLEGALSAHLKVAAVQYPVRGSQSLEQLLARMEHSVREAAAQGGGLVVFPELFVLDLLKPGDVAAHAAQMHELARIATPRIFERAGELSRELRISILSGSGPRATENGIVNTAQLSFPDGRVIHQDKIFLTPDEVAWNWTAGSELKVFDAPWGKSVILICYDSQFPSLSAALGAAAPEMILVPSMTGAKGFERVRWAAQARAVEHHAFVVVTGTVNGSRAANEFTAQAAFLTPQDAGFPGTAGKGVLNRPSIAYANLDFEKLRASRLTAGLYSARDAVARMTPIRVVVEGK